MFKVFNMANIYASCLSSWSNLGWLDICVFEIHAVWKPVPHMLYFQAVRFSRFLLSCLPGHPRCGEDGRAVKKGLAPSSRCSSRYPPGNADRYYPGRLERARTQHRLNQLSFSLTQGRKFISMLFITPCQLPESLQRDDAMQKGKMSPT